MSNRFVSKQLDLCNIPQKKELLTVDYAMIKVCSYPVMHGASVIYYVKNVISRISLFTVYF